MKRLMSLLLALVLVFCFISPAASANEDLTAGDAAYSGGEPTDGGEPVTAEPEPEPEPLEPDDIGGSAPAELEPSSDGGEPFMPMSLNYDDAPFELDRVIVKLAVNAVTQFSGTPDLGVEFSEAIMLNPSLGISRRDAETFNTFNVTATNNNMFALTLTETGVDAIENALAILNANPIVEYAQPSYLYESFATPNDPLFSTQWGMTKIDAPQAWNITTGSKDVVVGIIDSGIMGTHTDLQPNLWVNPNPNQGGFSNDIHGYNFFSNVGGTPTDGSGHGTHVAGIVGARGNNGIGVAGVNWNVSLAWLGIANSTGGGMTSANAVRAVAYAEMHKIPILNASFGGPVNDTALRDIIAAYSGIFIAASGNNGNAGNAPNYPANYDLPNVISVTSITSTDALAPTANTSSSVDIAAPGDSIYSTWNNGSYASGGGTSMAAPHVAGVAALIKAANPGFTTAQIRHALLSTTQSTPLHNFGILDAHAALVYATSVPGTPRNFAVSAGDARVTLSWAAPSDIGGSAITGYQVSRDGGNTWIAASSSTEHTFIGLTNGTSYNFMVRAVNAAGAGGAAAMPATPIDSVTAFVTRLYRICLSREPDARGLSGWVGLLVRGETDGAGVARGFVFSQEMNNRNVGNEEFVEILYRAFFDRPPDQRGFTYWVGMLNDGWPRHDVFAGFANSQEFTNVCNRFGITRGTYTPPRGGGTWAFVTRLYRECLGREPDRTGLNGWVNLLNSGANTGREVARGFVFSREMENKNLDNGAFVDILYRAMLGRGPDANGRAGWLRLMDEGMTRAQVFNGFAGSREFGDICNRYGIRR